MSSMAKVLRSLGRSGCRMALRGEGRVVLQSQNLLPLSHQSRPFSLSSSIQSSSSNKEISDFLKEEIAAERGNQKSLPTLSGGFKVEHDGAELKMIKSFGNERIEITLNVNHTVDSAIPDDGSQEAPEMKSKPNFEIDLIKENGKKVLSFSCSFIPDTEMESTISNTDNQMDDIFAIDEVTFSTSLEHKDSNYAVAGDILDGYLYDLLMNMLDERGVNSGFAEELSSYCSAYEHSLYIKMLEDVQGFTQ